MASSLPYVTYIHSILRYFILLFTVIVVIQCLVGMLGKKKFGKNNKITALLLLICCDLQLLLGIMLYTLGGWFHVLESPGVMRNTYSRFYAVEHSVGMIIAIILVHIGYSIGKKNIDDDRKFKRIFWSIFIALAIFFATIPWQGRQVVGRPDMPTLSTHS